MWQLNILSMPFTVPCKKFIGLSIHSGYAGYVSLCFPIHLLFFLRATLSFVQWCFCMYLFSICSRQSSLSLQSNISFLINSSHYSKIFRPSILLTQGLYCFIDLFDNFLKRRCSIWYEKVASLLALSLHWDDILGLLETVVTISSIAT